MALNTLKSKVKYRISRSKDTVFMPKDFFDLSGRAQVDRILRQLVAEGIVGSALCVPGKISMPIGTFGGNSRPDGPSCHRNNRH